MSVDHDPTTGSATTTINAAIADVFAAVTDVTRMGEWSPECVAVRWVGEASGPAVGAGFEGDNVVALGPITLKRWTTTSEIVAFERDALFEFVTEGHTNWRYEFTESDPSAGGARATIVTESFSHPPYAGWQKFVYGRLANRQRAMTAGLRATLDRIKSVLEV